MFILEGKSQPYAPDSGIQIKVVSSCLPLHCVEEKKRTPETQTSSRQLTEQWALQLYEWSERPKGPDLHLQALCSQAQTERRERYGFWFWTCIY
uniref:Uncharacterized protein n=1 Tax=Arundo donax TaxID=35708 RepID=A0A0A9D2K3_ARUDO